MKHQDNMNMIREVTSIDGRYKEVRASNARLVSDKFKDWCRNDKELERLRRLAFVANQAYLEALSDKARAMEKALEEKMRR